MSEKKNNIRSFRYSDEVAEILEGAEGATLNEKFENLVRKCYKELPAVKADIDKYERWLKKDRENYFKSLSLDKEIDSLVWSIGDLQKRIDALREKLDTMCNTL